jgi:hypothetical protein
VRPTIFQIGWYLHKQEEDVNRVAGAFTLHFLNMEELKSELQKRNLLEMLKENEHNHHHC